MPTRRLGALAAPPAWTPASNHGTFGQTTEWDGYRPGVAAWLGSRDRIQPVLTRLAALTRLSQQDIDAIETWVVEELVCEIDRVVLLEAASPDTELSAACARHGVLPMFGFHPCKESLGQRDSVAAVAHRSCRVGQVARHGSGLPRRQGRKWSRTGSFTQWRGSPATGPRENHEGSGPGGAGSPRRPVSSLPHTNSTPRVTVAPPATNGLTS